MPKTITRLLPILPFLLLTPTLYAHGLSEADKLSMINGDLPAYIKLGATHMLTGYDHLLFLFGVIFFLTRFSDILKFITAFTIGHSITLIFATFLQITANYYLIDAVIALTVIYKGFDNLDGFQKFLKTKSPNLIALVFVFGLIHGFGLSTRLQQLPLGDSGLLLKIISFNLGVEVGQILALTAMLVVLTTWRHTQSFKRFSNAANVSLIIAGCLLFLMQIHGYSHQTFPQDFNTPTNPALAQQSTNTTDAWQDTATITVPAKKGLEYKFHLAKNASLQYTWKTDGPTLYYDFHGEPTGDKTGYFESYEEANESTSAGNLTAPFDGSHGWYFKNNTTEEATITLKTKGAYKILGLQ